MLLGLCQSIETGIVPGNRNADNIDAELRKFEYLMYPAKTIHTDGIRANLDLLRFRPSRRQRPRPPPSLPIWRSGTCGV